MSISLQFNSPRFSISCSFTWATRMFKELLARVMVMGDEGMMTAIEGHFLAVASESTDKEDNYAG